MTIRIALVDAFTSVRFHGNPAVVCLLEEPQQAAWMQAVAAEMNQSETAFVRRLADGFELRWFTPTTEEELCGHATLATAHVLWELEILPATADARFSTRSGVLVARRSGASIGLDFPSEPAVPGEAPALLTKALGVTPRSYGRSRLDHLVELADESAVRAVAPDFRMLAELDGRGVIVTAKSDVGPHDFVSRFFAPNDGIVEDPVTGSAHCTLAPFWAARLHKTSMLGYQVSTRGGLVRVEHAGARTNLFGEAITVMHGTLTKP